MSCNLTTQSIPFDSLFPVQFSVYIHIYVLLLFLVFGFVL